MPAGLRWLAFAWAASAGCLSQAGAAAEPALAAPAPVAVVSAPADGPAAGLRHAHARRLSERLETDPLTLQQHCRFESDINTLPPAGKVALTFDDGPEPGHTEAILATLAKHNLPATFFLIGEKAQRHPELVARMQALPGVRLGGHSWSHPDFHHIGVEAQHGEIERSAGMVVALVRPLPPAVEVAASASAPDPIIETPAAAPALALMFRYPYGNSSCTGNQQLRALDFRIVGWHVDSCDWAFDGDGQVTLHEALSCGVLPAFRKDYVGHVLAGVRAHRGGIVLLHETHANTVRDLDEMLRRLKAEDMSFTTPDDPAFGGSLR